MSLSLFWDNILLKFSKFHCIYSFIKVLVNISCGFWKFPAGNTHTPTGEKTPCWPRPHVLTFVKVSKNTQMNFPYHTESISQHVDHFKPINLFLKKMLEKINYFPRRGGGYPLRGKFHENNEFNFWTLPYLKGIFLKKKSSSASVPKLREGFKN